MNPYATIAELHAAYRSGETTPRAAVEALDPASVAASFSELLAGLAARRAA